MYWLLSSYLGIGSSTRDTVRSAASADAAAFLILPWFKHVISLHTISFGAHCNSHVAESVRRQFRSWLFQPTSLFSHRAPGVFACL